jgi:hypothetical protein
VGVVGHYEKNLEAYVRENEFENHSVGRLNLNLVMNPVMDPVMFTFHLRRPEVS